jgi:NAD(P)-dependent dehydrogenase (short-subunit alcohol dehydrogenase family)
MIGIDSEMQLNGFDDRVALVTGGARGIGRAICERLRDLGARVAVGDLRAPDIDGVLGLELDVTSEASVDATFARVEAELGAPSILVLNAGIFVIEPFEETTLASWQRTIDVNLTGAFLCARRALPAMREAGYGRVVAIGSSAGKTGGAKAVAAYGASKAGVMTLAKAIASEYAPHGITSNALAPSLIDTDMISSMPDMAEKVPVGRLGTVDDVADAVAFLCSAHAGYITGEVVDVNGGFLID